MVGWFDEAGMGNDVLEVGAGSESPVAAELGYKEPETITCHEQCNQGHNPPVNGDKTDSIDGYDGTKCKGFCFGHEVTSFLSYGCAVFRMCGGQLTGYPAMNIL
jgi:hypothetical protein